VGRWFESTRARHDFNDLADDGPNYPGKCPRSVRSTALKSLIAANITTQPGLTRLALAILREADEPLPIRVVAVRALKAKGIAWPDPALRRRTRTKLREAFGKLRTRGVVEVVGTGNATRHRLATVP
jgi:hypothetical protein